MGYRTRLETKNGNACAIMAAINAAGTSALIARSHRREPNALNTLPDVVAATIKTLVSTGLSRADPRLAEGGSRG